MATDCISKGFADALITLINMNVSSTSLADVISSMPRCPTTFPGGGKSLPFLAQGKRAGAVQWPLATYVDEQGRIHEATSPTALHRELLGQEVSGQICLIEENLETGQKREDCKVVSVIDALAHGGFVIRGDGEPPPVKGVNQSYPEFDRSQRAWKDKLLREGKSIIVYHPNAPELRKATAETEKKIEGKKK